MLPVTGLMEWRGRAGGQRPSGGGGLGGRLRTAALVGGWYAVRFFDSASLRVDTVGRLGKPVRDPGGGGRLGCSGLSRRPQVGPGSSQPTSPFPTIVLPMFCARRCVLAPVRHLRRSLCFAQQRQHLRQQDASRVFPATRMRWRLALHERVRRKNARRRNISPPRRAAEDAPVTAQHDVHRWAHGR